MYFLVIWHKHEQNTFHPKGWGGGISLTLIQYICIDDFVSIIRIILGFFSKRLHALEPNFGKGKIKPFARKLTVISINSQYKYTSNVDIKKFLNSRSWKNFSFGTSLWCICLQKNYFWIISSVGIVSPAEVPDPMGPPDTFSCNQSLSISSWRHIVTLSLLRARAVYVSIKKFHIITNLN